MKAFLLVLATLCFSANANAQVEQALPESRPPDLPPSRVGFGGAAPSWDRSKQSHTKCEYWPRLSVLTAWKVRSRWRWITDHHALSE